MNTKLIAGALLTLGAAAAWADKDPVIMTVNGVDVPLSEFEYLYNKNNQQQLAPQTLDEYLEMFKLYKLKVADARNEGIDTTANFIKEMKQYRRDLATPYMTDSAYLHTFVDEAYDRSREEAEAKHIMLMKTRDYKKNLESRQLLDSIRREILNGADFSEMARQYSQDRTASTNGGNLGFVTVNRFPYAFESAVFTLKEGELSDIIESSVGYHLVQGGKHRPARGTVLAEHIMKSVPKFATPETQKKAKEAIDSLYNVVKANPESFEKVAAESSDDKGSARMGGRLPWFGAGDMVPEFDSVAFAIGNGEIGGPIQSQYGWHIVKRIAGRPVIGKEEMAKMLLPRINSPQDERYKLIRAHLTETLERKHKGKFNNAVLEELAAATETNGIDSVFMAYWRDGNGSKKEIYSIAGKGYTIGNVLAGLKNSNIPDTGVAREYISNAARNGYGSALIEAEENWLAQTQPDYRNLLKEYEDGSLLYEVSVEKVWDKASKDEEGLKKYFETHRRDYKWKEPKVKGYLIQALNDSVADLVKARLPQIKADSIVPTIRKEFTPNVTIEKCLVSKGTNPMVDNLMFDGKKVNPSIANYTTYFLYDARLLNEPEEVADVKGQVTSDYQNEFQTAWEEELRNRYPVKINEKVLNKAKKKYK